MRRLQRTLVLLLLGVACGPIGRGPQTPEGGVVAGSPTAQWLEARDVRVEPLGSGRRVTIALTREPDGVQDLLLTGPSRLVVDLAGPRPTGGGSITQLRLSDDLVTQARVGSHGASLRAVFDLSHDPGRHTVRREGTNVIIDLGDVTAAVPANGALAADSSATPPTSAPLERAEANEVSAPAGRASRADGLAVRDVRVEPVGTGRRLTVELTQAPDDLHQFMLPSPPRLVLDLRGPHAKLASPVGRFALADDLISRVRTASNGDTLRVVIDFRKRPDTPAVRQEGARLIAEIGTTGAARNTVPEASLAPAIAEEPVGEKPAADAPTPTPAAAVIPPHADVVPEPVTPPPAAATAEPPPPAAAAAEPPPPAEVPPPPHARTKEPGPREVVGDH